MEEQMTDRLSRYIKSLGLTHEEFAKSIGMKKTTFSNKIQGIRSIDADMLVVILTTYPDLSADWLLTGHGKMEKASFNDLELKDQMIATLQEELSQKNQQLNEALSAITKVAP